MLKHILKRFNKRKYIIEGKTYVETKNAYESDVMIYKRGNNRTYVFDKYLKLK